MSRETDKKVAKWLGWKPFEDGPRVGYVMPNGEFRREEDIPKYSGDDSKAVGLLPELIRRGYFPEMYYSTDSEGFSAWYFTENPGQPYFVGQTVAQAICASVSVLADSI